MPPLHVTAGSGPSMPDWYNWREAVFPVWVWERGLCGNLVAAQPPGGWSGRDLRVKCYFTAMRSLLPGGEVVTSCPWEGYFTAVFLPLMM